MKSRVAVAGVVVSVVFAWLAIRNVEWSQLLDTVRQVRLVPFAAGIAAMVLAYVVMACRWRVLIGTARSVSLSDVFDFTMIGFFSGLVLPQRLGDLVKAALLGQRIGMSRTTILGTVAVERLTDVVMLLALACGVAVTMTLPVALSAALWALAAVTVVLAVGLWIGPARWPRLLAPMLRHLPAKVDAAVTAACDKFAAGVHAVRDPRRFGRALAFAAALWLMSGLGMSAFVVAFRIDAPWYAGFLVILLTNLGGILPTSPGALGVYDYLAVLALGVWTPNHSAALGFAVATHAINLGLMAVLGGWSLGRQGLSLRTIRRSEELSNVVA